MHTVFVHIVIVHIVILQPDLGDFMHIMGSFITQSACWDIFPDSLATHHRLVSGDLV